MQTNQNLPFRFQEVFKLTSLGLDPNLFKFGNLTFESQKYICVKDGAVSVTLLIENNYSPASFKLTELFLLVSCCD